MLSPIKINRSSPASAKGVGVTTTVMVSVLVHMPPDSELENTAVYVVVEDGVTVGF